jgi:hypothetical protein
MVTQPDCPNCHGAQILTLRSTVDHRPIRVVCPVCAWDPNPECPTCPPGAGCRTDLREGAQP